MTAGSDSVGATRRLNEGVFRYSVAHFLVALVLLLVSVPLVEEFIGGEILESILITVVLLSAVIAVGGRRRSLVVGLLLVVPAVLSNWIDHVWPGSVPREFTQAAAILFLAFVTYRLLHFILTAPRVNSEVLCGAVAVYLILGLIWAFAYSLIAGLNPKAFAFTVSADPKPVMFRFQALYFSFVALTTVGYGDIVPLSKQARLLAVTESTAGVLYTTILIARLVALYSGGRREDSD
jgi:voltage-gated potassium channel Kch